jgi:hypothetical protein
MASHYGKALQALDIGNVERALRELIAEIARKDQIIADLLSKLDNDSGVTDTNYNVVDDQ